MLSVWLSHPMTGALFMEWNLIRSHHYQSISMNIMVHFLCIRLAHILYLEWKNFYLHSMIIIIHKLIILL